MVLMADTINAAPLFHELFAAIAQAAHSSAATGLANNALSLTNKSLWRASYLALGELGRRPVGFEKQRGGA